MLAIARTQHKGTMLFSVNTSTWIAEYGVVSLDHKDRYNGHQLIILLNVRQPVLKSGLSFRAGFLFHCLS